MKKYDGMPNFTGKVIEQARKKKHFKKTDLCTQLELLGIALDRNEIYRIEKNQMIVKDFELLAIAKVLDISLDELKEEIGKDL